MIFISFKHDFLNNNLFKLVAILVLCVYLINSYYDVHKDWHDSKSGLIVFHIVLLHVEIYGPRDGKIKKIGGDLSLSVD